MLVVDGLSRRYGGVAAVAGAAFQVERGSFVGVIGRSGAGKSTLLRMINRLIDPSEGRVVFDGVDITALKGQELRLWRRRAAMIFQQFNLVGRLDVLTNVLMGRVATVPTWRALLGLWPDEDKAIALSALEQFDIASLAAQRAEHLSGGQQQRVAIARALVQEPELILADEPIASLDPRNTRLVMDALLRINRHFGITIICNLHSLDIARGCCDRLLGMAAGRLVFDGAPARLTDAVAREIYGLESEEVLDGAPRAGGTPKPVPALGEAAAAGGRKRNEGVNTREVAMPDRRTTLAGAVALAFAVNGASAQDYKTKYPELVFAKVPDENASGTSDRWTPLVHYLSKELGVKVTLRIANDYAAVVEGQRAGNIHIAMYGPASYARAFITGARVEPFAIEVSGDGTKGYYSVLYVKADSPYKAVQDLKDKNLCLVDPNSTSGNNVPRYALHKMGIEPESFFSKVV